MLFVYGMRYGITLFPTRPERAEAHSPGQRPGLFWAVACRPVRAKALKPLVILLLAYSCKFTHYVYISGEILCKKE